MKKKILFLLVIFHFTTHLSFGQNPVTLQDSIQIFYDSLFYHMETDYLYRKQVDWKSIKTLMNTQVQSASNFEEALSYCTLLFDSLQDRHCQIFYQESYFTNSNHPNYTAEDFSESFVQKYNEEGSSFEVKIIGNQYGYVRIPGMLLINADVDSLSSVAQGMYDAIVALEEVNSIKGWIIDLRFNIGGNAYTMIAALYHLIGDTIVYTALDVDKKVFNNHSLKEGIFYTEDKVEAKVIPDKNPDITTPVACIIGKITSSAGEDVAVAFKGRENILFIGEPSSGYLTGNDRVELPFGVVMAITTGYIADRNANYVERIIPSIFIEKQDNFENLELDPNVIEAINFIESSY